LAVPGIQGHFCGLLDEQQRRFFAGLESMRLGQGGNALLADFLGLDADTVARGRQQLLAQEVVTGRTRRAGGGGHLVEKRAVSVDTKNCEVVGTFYNSGRRWARTPCRVLDHDFRTDTIGIAIPYGIYDLTENRGTLVVGVSHDTPAFAADAITYW